MLELSPRNERTWLDPESQALAGGGEGVFSSQHKRVHLGTALALGQSWREASQPESSIKRAGEVPARLRQLNEAK